MPIDPAPWLIRKPALSLIALLALSGPVAAEGPLSAIDWLSESVSPRGATQPAASAAPQPRAGVNEPPPVKSATPGKVSVSVIGAATVDGLGLLSAARTGLPHQLWALTPSEELARQITAERVDTLPALRSLLITLLLAETAPPVDSDTRGILFLSRVDKLLAIGALDQAAALTGLAGPTTPEIFRRHFDIALLQGEEDAACATMQSAPHLAPTLPARIYCMARAGDWQTAALTFDTSLALGTVAPETEALLERFLDPELADGAEPLPQPETPTPLVWRMYEAIGEPLPTLGLPLAFAHAELRPQAGWKAQLEAAERLAKAGAISAATLLAIYAEREPAASGGVWDRVQAFQDFDAALQSGKLDAISETLPVAWNAMADAELEIPFAQLYAERLMRLPLQGTVMPLVLRIGLLSPQYERAAAARQAVQPSPAGEEAFLIGLALGQIEGLPAPDSMARALAPAFLRAEVSEDAQRLIDDRRIGEALLLAIDLVGRGVTGEPRRVAEGLSLLRLLGLEDVARRTALELLLLERRG